MASLIPWRRRSAGLAEKPPLSQDLPFMLSRMRDEFDRFLENFPSLWQGDGWRWGIDVEDTDEAIVVKAEAPGFEPGDFDLQVRDGELVMKACKKVETKDKEGKVTEVRERECHQTVQLPTGINQDKVEARYQNGILTVTLPKTPQAKGKKVAVKSA